MSIVVSVGSEQYAVGAFSRDLPGEDRPIVDVAVVWDGPAPRGPTEEPRVSFAQSLGLLVRALVGRPPARALRRRPEPVPLPAGWNSAVDHGGPREVLHSAHRRLVRVAQHEYPLPHEDATLVLLVRGDPVAEPVVRQRLLTPAVRFEEPPFGVQPPLLARLFGGLRGTIPWLAALMRDPEVAAVLDPRRRRAS